MAFSSTTFSPGRELRVHTAQGVCKAAPCSICWISFHMEAHLVWTAAPPVSAGSGYRRVAEDTPQCPAGGPGNLDGNPAHCHMPGKRKKMAHQFLGPWVVPQLRRALVFPKFLCASLSLACAASCSVGSRWLAGGTAPGVSVHLMCSWGEASSVATYAAILDSPLKCVLIVLAEASNSFSHAFEIKTVKKICLIIQTCSSNLLLF